MPCLFSVNLSNKDNQPTIQSQPSGLVQVSISLYENETVEFNPFHPFFQDILSNKTEAERDNYSLVDVTMWGEILNCHYKTNQENNSSIWLSLGQSFINGNQITQVTTTFISSSFLNLLSSQTKAMRDNDLPDP